MTAPADVSDGDLVRSRTDAKIYLVLRGLRRHIPDEATFRFLQFQPSAVKHFTQAEVDSIPLGVQMPSFERREELQVSREATQTALVFDPLLPLKISRRNVLLVVALVVVAILIAIVVPQIIPYPTHLDPAQREQAIGAFRTALVQVLAALAVVGGLFVTVQTLALGRQNLAASTNNQVAERFGASLELASIKQIPDVRLGGILALKRIALTTQYESDRESIASFLCSILRLDARKFERTNAEYTEAITALTEFRRSKHERFYDLVNVRLDALHERSIDLSRSSLNGAWLTNLRNVKSDLSHLSLVGATLSFVDFRKSQIIELLARDTVFEHCDVSHCVLTNAIFIRCSMDWISLVGSDVSGVVFIGCDLRNANLESTDLSLATFFDCDFSAYQRDRGTKLPDDVADPKYGNFGL